MFVALHFYVNVWTWNKTMICNMLKGKIHRVTVTGANIDYEGSCSIDKSLMDAAGILPNEVIHIWNVTNGERFDTYSIPAEPLSGIVCMNGASAHKATPGDIVIIATYAFIEIEEAKHHSPVVVLVDEQNRIKGGVI
jgi:aspartate 1-decarboxylase